MAWTVSDARDRFRICIGDGLADHYEHKSEVTPTADGLHDQFFVGRTRLVEPTVRCFLNGVELDDEFEVDPVPGLITVLTPTPPSGVVLASYYWQWFTDAEIDVFLQDAANALGFTGVDDATLPVALQSVIMDWGAAVAYTRKAAEWAEALQASTPDGYSLDTGKAHPNWAKLAQDAMKRGKDKLDAYLESPLAFSKPEMRLTSFRLPVYIPPGT